MMLTVDQIRRELEGDGFLKRKEESMDGAVKACKHHPNRPAFLSKSGRNMGLCHECIVAARRKSGKNRREKALRDVSSEQKAVIAERKEKAAKRGRSWRAAKKLDNSPAVLAPIPEIAGEVPAKHLKLFCMRCGFPMEIQSPERFVVGGA